MGSYGLELKDLEELLVNMNEKKFRAKQIFHGIYKDFIDDFTELTTIKKDLAIKLNEVIPLKHFKLVKRQISNDKTEKFLFELDDHELIETVLMDHNYGLSLCVSSQVGCAMGCAFCASGLLGLKRSLTTDEIVNQVVEVSKITKKRISSIVVMGIGEPFTNYHNVMKFIRIINYDLGLAIGARHITVSTCGIVPKIYDYAYEGLQTNLAISLHAPNDAIRDRIMKINHKYSINEVCKAVKDYIDITNRRVTIEYILLDGINDSHENALELAKLLKGLNVYINLIPYNSVNENEFRRSKRIDEFFDDLKKQGLNVTARKEQGGDIDAACGQLRSLNMHKK